MKDLRELTVSATIENLAPVQEFVESTLEEYDCPMVTIMQISIAVEEIYVNIAHYAYRAVVGNATIRCEIDRDPLSMTLEFSDSGTPFNPLAKEDADVTLSAEARDIGGLGIYMVKQSMDAADYRYEDGKNILTITKIIQ